jgi:hypothetical protein
MISGKKCRHLNRAGVDIGEKESVVLPTLPFAGFCDTTSLGTIAQQLHLPVEKVQQIAFRLLVAGIAEEISIVAATSSLTHSTEFAESLSPQAGTTNISHSFLQSLVGFLKKRT